jgi:RimJ/RimL family protein N-acetyltransferase
MAENNLSVREIQESDIELITRYWLEADDQYLVGMGVDLSKLPSEQEWKAMLLQQVQTPLEEKKSYCMIWQVENQPIGHSNVNKIIFGEEAYMHLHIWEPTIRKKGYGRHFIKLTVPHFFDKLHLKTLYCEPYALNPAPNKTLEKAGFSFIKEYTTIPGSINFEQPVKLWALSAEALQNL